MDVPAFFHHGDDRACAIIDDLALRVKSKQTAYDLRDSLSKLSIARGGVAVKLDFWPKAWGGLEYQRSADKQAIYSHMQSHIMKSTMRWLPELATTGKVPARVPQGKALKEKLDNLVRLPKPAGAVLKLTKEQRSVCSIVGDLRWMCRRIVIVVRGTHLLSMVIANPQCPDAMDAALGLMARAYMHQWEGRTWRRAEAALPLMGVLKGTRSDSRNTTVHRVDGGELAARGAPADPSGIVDTTWNLHKIPREFEDVADSCVDVYALAMTMSGAAVHIELKRTGLTGGSSPETEGMGLLRLTDRALQMRLVAERLNVPLGGATWLMSDSDGSLRVASGETSANRLRHALRRTAQVTQRLRSKEVRLAHLPDAANHVDMFTKWLDATKVATSLAYLTGAVAHSAHFGDARNQHTASHSQLSAVTVAIGNLEHACAVCEAFVAHTGNLTM